METGCTVRYSYPCRGKIFFSFSNVKFGLGAHSSNGYRSLFLPRVRQSGRELKHWPPSGAEVKNEWSCPPWKYLLDVASRPGRLESSTLLRETKCVLYVLCIIYYVWVSSEMCVMVERKILLYGVQICDTEVQRKRRSVKSEIERDRTHNTVSVLLLKQCGQPVFYTTNILEVAPDEKFMSL
jgi:hypothetical protein